ncbi:hypothetical protein [Corallococcus exiguus]|uniref:Lipoprotein n=1 Tax=Corallococcus exiguus TaxID=83462 RepID=A0A7X5BWI0_9BACT|nr:hypothetical protein [Corallococcus exiguus]NBC44248.1 hypothetical protein [Corallococcus exiguus]TNV63884.1 hypothetical protein FH620_14075 [Corallococcus exiguus]
MKRGFLAALLLSGASLALACSDTTSTAGAAGLSGTYDVVLSNQLVFVTSQDRDELRVLDLTRTPREFIPAPNPLEPLAIPVIARPDSLTRDVGYNDKGEDVSGPYIYARSSGGRGISVVAADRARLNEVTRLATGQLITAFAAHAPVAEGAPSVLYYALQTRPEAAEQLCGPFGGGVVMRQDLPGPEGFDAATLPPALPVFCLKPADTVMSMLTLPARADRVDSLVVAIRNVSGTSRLVRVVADGASVEIPYKRPRPAPYAVPNYADLVDIPARLVATHPSYGVPKPKLGDGSCPPGTDVKTQEDETTICVESWPAGRFVFVVLDELTCNSSDCEGVIALDNGPKPVEEPSPTPVLARDITGAAMLTLRPSAGLPTGLTLRTGLEVRELLADSVAYLTAIPLLGIMPSSDGRITLFRADERRPFNLDRNSNNTPLNSSVVAELRDNNELARTDQFQGITVVQPGCPQATDSTNVTAFLCNGSVPNGTYRFVFQGVLPGLVGLSRDLTQEDPPLLVETTLATARGVSAGDSIILANNAGACAAVIPILRLEDQGNGLTRLFPDLSDPAVAAAAEPCASYPLFTVRAGPNVKPFVLYAGAETSDTYLQRLNVNETYTVSTFLDYYYHPDGFDLGLEPPKSPTTYVPAPLSLTMTPTIGAGSRLAAGDRYVVTLLPRFRRYVFGVDTSQSSGLAVYTLPASVVATDVAGASLAYVAYPSADGVLQVALESITDNLDNLTYLRAFQ